MAYPAAHPCISHIREYPPEHKYPTTSLFHFRQEPIEGNPRGSLPQIQVLKQLYSKAEYTVTDGG